MERCQFTLLLLELRGQRISLWTATKSTFGTIGCALHALYDWVRRHEVDDRLHDGVNAAERERIKDLEREVTELRRAK